MLVKIKVPKNVVRLNGSIKNLKHAQNISIQKIS